MFADKCDEVSKRGSRPRLVIDLTCRTFTTCVIRGRFKSVFHVEKYRETGSEAHRQNTQQTTWNCQT